MEVRDFLSVSLTFISMRFCVAVFDFSVFKQALIVKPSLDENNITF